MSHVDLNRNRLLSSGIVLLFLFISPLAVFSQTEEGAPLFVLKGNTKFMSGKPAEGVEIELEKNGKSLAKIVSGKNGKYFVEMEVSTLDPKNEYILHITQAGTIPKSLIVNAYIPPDEFSMNNYPRYDFTLEIKMIETNSTEIILEKPSGKIRWDNQLHNFTFDQVYAKIIQKEDPDKLAAEKKRKEEEELARRKSEEELAKKKADEELARKKADEEARLKAEEEAKRLAAQKSKEEADKALQQNLEAMKLELRRKRKQDSLDSLAVLAAKKQEQPTPRLEKPVSPQYVDQNGFDGTSAYSINIAMKSQKAYQDNIRKEKSKNLTAKYETINTLTSLLNVVDEEQKKAKRQ